MDVHKNLNEVGVRLTKAKEELRIAEEQLLYQMDVVEETKTRALVSETPIADQEFRVAREDFERMKRHRDEVAGIITELQAEQDRLLDRMLASQA